MPEQEIKQPVKKRDIKIIAAASVTIMNMLLTIFKFILYSFSGSMAILAEAWHSFSDIATSFLVLIAILFSAADKSRPTDDSEDASGPANKNGKIEIAASIFIGLLLFFISVILLKKCVTSEPVAINNPVLSGIIFIIFSFGSYFIYRFETSIGKKEGSIGLVSDGMHARADMIASLLTGFSLIIYAMGLDIDRWVAGLIALFILSFSIETLINVGIACFGPDKTYYFKFRLFDMLSSLINLKTMKLAVENINNISQTLFGRPVVSVATLKLFISIPFIVLFIAYMSSAFFLVAINEKALVERFGKPIDNKDAVGPGLHMKLPWPIDRVIKVDATTIRTLNVGNISDSRQQAFLWTVRHGSEVAFLSGDNNFFFPYIILHYRINNIHNYFYKHTNPDLLLNELGHRTATKLFVKQSFFNIATTYRKALEQEMLIRLQEELNKLESGIELVSVNFRDIHPPISVADSFERVIAGYQDKQKMINDALRYKNKVLPETRGEMSIILEGAKGYIQDREKRAKGTAGRFTRSLPDSKTDKALAMFRLYLETIQSVLKGKPKIIVDPEVEKPEVWMDFKRNDDLNY